MEDRVDEYDGKPEPARDADASQQIALDPAQYWKMRAKMLEHEARVSRSAAEIHAAMRVAGLDPAKQYQLNDDTCTATVR